MISRYGYDVYFTVVTLCVVAAVLSAMYVDPKWLRYSLYGVSFVVVLFATNFFRDPERSAPQTEGVILSPADGKVIEVKEVQQSEFIGANATQVSIFMSPLNVHVNRNPISGVVKHLRYVPGEYFAAFEEKASEKNEQMVIGIENEGGKVLFKQIAGFVARRIVCALALEERVKAGERFGMIKFGSRVDIFFRTDAAVKVKRGDITRAGETILAQLP